MAGIAQLATVVLDCSDPLALAAFYQKINGWELDDGSDAAWATLIAPTGVSLAFQRIDDYVAPEWPGNDRPQQFHLDFELADLDQGEQAVLGFGAIKADYQPGQSFRVYFDPEGHPFCLCQAG